MTIAGQAAAIEWLEDLPECDAAAMARLERLVELLTEENTRQNLVSTASLADVWTRHIADSAQLLPAVPRETTPWLDLGTGAGFPGLVVAALRPDIEVVMVESRARRVTWLEHACDELGLGNASVEGRRLELVPSQPMRVISARAFAPLDQLLRVSGRFSTADTLWLLPKGRSAAQELRELNGWSHTFHVEQSLTDAESGVIVGHLMGIRKEART
jgi:16S rRNA (guanine527-N7)-methyltransferase